MREKRQIKRKYILVGILFVLLSLLMILPETVAKMGGDFETNSIQFTVSPGEILSNASHAFVQMIDDEHGDNPNIRLGVNDGYGDGSTVIINAEGMTVNTKDVNSQQVLNESGMYLKTNIYANNCCDSTTDLNLSNYTNNLNWVNNSTMRPDTGKINKTNDTVESGWYLNSSNNKGRYLFETSGYVNITSNSTTTKTFITMSPGAKIQSNYDSGSNHYQTSLIAVAFPAYVSMSSKDSTTGLGYTHQVTPTGDATYYNSTTSLIRFQNFSDFVLYTNITVSNLSGSGNTYIRLDSSGKLIKDEIDGYSSGNVTICYNSTAGMYAC